MKSWYDASNKSPNQASRAAHTRDYPFPEESRTSQSVVSIPVQSVWSGRSLVVVPNGSSISTPISSMPNRTYEISSVAGIVAQPNSATRAKGSVKQ